MISFRLRATIFVSLFSIAVMHVSSTLASPETILNAERSNLAESCSSLELLDGFLAEVNVNGDDLQDIVVNYQRVMCDDSQMMFCGSGGCTHNVYIQEQGATFVQVGSFLTYEIRFDRPADGSFVVASHGMNCGNAGAETCYLRFKVAGDTVEAVEEEPAPASGQASAVQTGMSSQVCGFFGDINAINSETVGEVSTQLVQQASEVVRACSASVENESPSAELHRAIALAAIPERANEARQLARKLSDGGSAEARNLLGSMLSNGIGGPVNDTQAAILFHQAAQAGIVPAMFNYGMARLHGIGLPADREHAVLWLERAIAAGDAEAMSVLGTILLSGDGQIADRPRGLELLHAAVDANGLRSASEAKAAYDYLASFSGGHDLNLPPHAQTASQAGENWEKFLALAAERGDRRFMVEKVNISHDTAAVPSVLEAVIAPVRPEDRLAAWLSRISSTYPDRDQDVYAHLLLYRGMLLYSVEMDIQPYIDRMAERLAATERPSSADGLEADNQLIVEMWNESVELCTVPGTLNLDGYLHCARADSLAEVLWIRGQCPHADLGQGWHRCDE